MNVSSFTLSALILSIVLDSSTGMFLQAITAALAAVPLTGGPLTMTAGLAAAKLVIGSKLLFYLGFFRSKASKAPVSTRIPDAASLLKSAAAFRQQVLFPQAPLQGYPALPPLPYLFSAGGSAYVPQQLGTPGLHTGFPQNYFPQQYGQDFNPSQTYQTYGGNPNFGVEASFPNQGYPPQRNSFLNDATFSEYGQHHKNPSLMDDSGILPGEMPQDFSAPLPSKQNEYPVSVDNQEDIESFFTFLKDMDDNKCISRLICDIGANPNFLGEFSENIDGIIGSLEVSPDSRASHYISTLKQGREDQGGCIAKFPECTEEAYEIVKSVAPSVGIPQNSHPSA